MQTSSRFTEEKELIELLQNHISSLSDEVEDAKDALFSEIEHQSFSMECEMILKIQTQVKIGKRKCKQLSKRIEECEMQQSIMRKQLNEMNSRIEENEKYKIGLLQRKAEAERITVCWRNRAAPLQLSDSCSVSSPLNVHHQSNV
uniref:CC122 protein n=1 Tax=Elaeophora elaphi TaxID=1147741 RepID=A0A0R3RQM5_9BILA